MKRVAVLILCLMLMAVSIASAESVTPDIVTYSFAIPTSENTLFTLSEQLGKVVVLNFWATWCGPCVREMPALNQLYSHYQDADDVVILAVNCAEQPTKVQKFLETKGFIIPAGYDLEQQACMTYNIQSIPTTVVFNRSGMVEHYIVGVLDRMEVLCDRYIEIIESLREADD